MNRSKFIKSAALGGTAIFTESIQKVRGFPFVLRSKSMELFKTDVLIYGGTSAAIIAAVRAKKLGKDVIIVSPDKHLGGMTSSGLSMTDSGNAAKIGGLAREFYHRIYLHYQKDSSWNWQKRSDFTGEGQGVSAIENTTKTMWVFEPHVAENVFEDMVRENNLKVFRGELIDRMHGGTYVRGGKIISFVTWNRKVFAAKIFIDATYEGDLMAEAGVSYYVGREPNSMYNEKYNGVQPDFFVRWHPHHFLNNIDPYKIPGNPLSGLLPKISVGTPGIKGEGDQKIQAYCFRTCLTNNPDNLTPFPKPEGYDPSQYELLARIFKAGWGQNMFRKFDPIPNMKVDQNNFGPFSTDNIGMNYAYPNAMLEVRNNIIREHENYQKGLMYFMATDHSVPKDLQKELNTWGLSKDEFIDNGNWPYSLYIREARRMIGEFVMTENEILGKKFINDPVGIGSYALDSHSVQRYVKSDGFVQNEGDIGVLPPKPYGISYRSLIPKVTECNNLLVPVCAACSHTAYGSIRMEPVFMILGESAATAASMAIDDNKSVQEVDYGLLKKELLNQQQIL